ncbi:MAG: NUDIX hydrolase [Ilumatobacteraceae bacterium]|jgi:8-oxo-dGTP pyrophosphatase MutT (NUDIX family)
MTPNAGSGVEPRDDGKAAKSRPAATVVVARESSASTCGLEVLMLRRSDVGAFAGMWVFPGGRVDDSDAGESELERAASAAVREAREEVGVQVARESLVTWSHWTPPLMAPVRFTTWFFVAPWRGDDVRIDGHEIVDHRWLAPDAALSASLPMAPPTIVTLHELAESAASVWSGRGEPPAYVTRPAQTVDGTAVLLWNGDAGYESGDADAAGARNRLVMLDGFGGQQWRYERLVP